MKSFDELFEEFKKNEEINKIGNEVIAENKKIRIITWVLWIIIDVLFIYVINNKFKTHAFLNRGLMGLGYTHSFIRYMIIIIPVISINTIIAVSVSSAFSKNKRNFLPIFKEQIITKMINNFFDNVEYSPNKGMIQGIYGEGKYEGYDRYSSDDYIETKIDNKYSISFAEVLTEEEREEKDANGHTRTVYHTIFHGLFAKAIMNKSINSDLRITYHSGYKNKLEMDSSEFEKEFNVFASNKIIGMQILTADIMDDILEFKKEINEYFDIYINNENLYLRFYCGSLFEPYFRGKTILDKKSLYEYYQILMFTDKLTKKIIKAINEVEI